ncbi:thioredoxin [Candidatus Shapirobacteria bacterium]|nr:thioredoxin [Candidatus Shapirobacteria bacterium]
MSNLTNVIGKVNFEANVIKSELPVLVDFWAPWCGPCQMMAPVLDELAKEFGGKLNIVKVDTDQPENQSLAMDYEIRSIPNLKLFKDGKVIKDFVGFRPKDAFAQDLKQFLD